MAAAPQLGPPLVFPADPACATVYAAITPREDGGVQPGPGVALPAVPNTADVAVCHELHDVAERCASHHDGPPPAVRRQFANLSVEAQSRHANGKELVFFPLAETSFWGVC